MVNWLGAENKERREKFYSLWFTVYGCLCAIRSSRFTQRNREYNGTTGGTLSHFSTFIKVLTFFYVFLSYSFAVLVVKYQHITQLSNHQIVFVLN